jgi:ABC-type transport system substrate-binding protein
VGPQEVACPNARTVVNGYGGRNFTHWCNRSADDLMRQSDLTLDPRRRAERLQGVGRLLADELPMLPVDSPPVVAAWRTDRIAGVDPADVSSP